MAMGGSSKRQTAAEALSQSKQAQQDLTALRSEVARLRRVLQALWELVKGSSGLNDDQLLESVKKIQQAEKEESRVADACPACGRALQAHSEFCIYCGAKVERHEIF